MPTIFEKTKRPIVELCMRILSNHKPNDSVNTDEKQYLLNCIFVRHPHWTSKSLKPISDITVVSHPIFNCKCFCLIYEDGSKDNISYRKCFRSFSTKSLTYKYSAFRHAIQDEISDIRNKVFQTNTLCPITGRFLTPKNLHIHHDGEYTFKQIVDIFCEINNLDIRKISIEKFIRRNTTLYRLTSPNLIKYFREFHNSLAKLTPLSKEGHNLLHGDLRRK